MALHLLTHVSAGPAIARRQHSQFHPAEPLLLVQGHNNLETGVMMPHLPSRLLVLPRTPSAKPSPFSCEPRLLLGGAEPLSEPAALSSMILNLPLPGSFPLTFSFIAYRAQATLCGFQSIISQGRLYVRPDASLRPGPASSPLPATAS